MTRRSVGGVLDELVEFSYAGVPTLTIADMLETVQDAQRLHFRRPRLASFEFSPYARTPVHDLPHNGVGVVALPAREWRHLIRAFRKDLPSEIDMLSLYSIAVEEW